MKLIPDLTVTVEFFETPRGRASLKRLPNVSVDYRDARSGEHGYRRMMQLAHTEDLRYTRFRNVPFLIREGNEKRIRSFAVALLSFDHEISEGEVRAKRRKKFPLTAAPGPSLILSSAARLPEPMKTNRPSEKSTSWTQFAPRVGSSA
jgi:hypothetical protein